MKAKIELTQEEVVDALSGYLIARMSLARDNLVMPKIDVDTSVIYRPVVVTIDFDPEPEEEEASEEGAS